MNWWVRGLEDELVVNLIICLICAVFVKVKLSKGGPRDMCRQPWYA